jgi:citrate lyase gamma subunit
MDNTIDMNEILKELQFQVDCYDNKIIDSDDFHQAIEEIIQHSATKYNVKNYKLKIKEDGK